MCDIKTKAGRPKKYQSNEERLEVRRKQNKVNQQRCRRRKKLLNEILSVSDYNIAQSYRSALVSYISKYEYNYFFTGTIAPKRIELEQLSQENNEIKELNLDLDLLLSYKKTRRIGINSLRAYTEKYLGHLCEKDLIERCFIIYEEDKSNNLHVHILFQSNAKAHDFKRLSENKWLLGLSYCRAITTDKEKLNTVNYMVKEINCHATRKSDINKVDSWWCGGKFNMEDNYIN